MGTDDGAVVVGAGHGGLSCALALREEGWSGPVTLIGDEPHPPYDRPPLSKRVLVDPASAGSITLADGESLARSEIRLVSGRVERIDRAARKVLLVDGTRRGYDHLVLATGAVPRTLPDGLPGARAVGVQPIRTLDDALAVAALLEDSDDVVVLGGGFIGVEAAAAIAISGRRVTLLEKLDALLPRVAPQPLADWVAAHLAGLGVDVRTSTTATAVETDASGRVTAVRDSAGGCHAARLVVLGLGALPASGLAEAAGLTVDGGIVVDGQLATADPHVSAIGDCAVQIRGDGSRHRYESVQAAQDQGRHVARRLVHPATAPYDEVPWFWSDIGPSTVQLAGRMDLARRTVVRGGPGSGSFSLFGYDGEDLVGVAAVDRPRDYLAGRALLRKGRSLPATVVADESADLRALARRA